MQVLLSVGGFLGDLKSGWGGAKSLIKWEPGDKRNSNYLCNCAVAVLLLLLLLLLLPLQLLPSEIRAKQAARIRLRQQGEAKGKAWTIAANT